MNDDTIVTVCSHCLQASCWQAIFFCDDYKTAGTVNKTVRELKALNLEHSDYWKTDEELASVSGASASSSAVSNQREHYQEPKYGKRGW